MENLSETGLSNLVETLPTNVFDIKTSLAAKRNTAQYVGAQPTANNASAPLSTSRFEARACLALLAAVGALYRLRYPLLVHARHPLISL